MKIIKYLQIMFSVLKTVIELVKTFEKEDVENGEKNGTEKKEAVISAVEVFYDSADDFLDIPLSKEKVLSAADKLIDIVVDFFKLTGIFKSKSEKIEEIELGN